MIVLGTILGGLVAILLEGLLLMLLLMGLHEYVAAEIPALGYWPSVLVVLALNFVGAFFRRG